MLFQQAGAAQSADCQVCIYIRLLRHTRTGPGTILPPTQTHTHTHTHPHPQGDNFANSKMDNFSLKLLKNLLEFFYVNAKQEVYLKVKKLFKAKTTMFRKA